jgi:hypothetical protein
LSCRSRSAVCGGQSDLLLARSQLCGRAAPRIAHKPVARHGASSRHGDALSRRQLFVLERLSAAATSLAQRRPQSRHCVLLRHALRVLSAGAFALADRLLGLRATGRRRPAAMSWAILVVAALGHDIASAPLSRSSARARANPRGAAVAGDQRAGIRLGASLHRALPCGTLGRVVAAHRLSRLPGGSPRRPHSFQVKRS